MTAGRGACNALEKFAQTIWVDLVAIKCIRPFVHEVNRFLLRWVRSNALLLHLYFVLLDPFHLIAELRTVVGKNLFAIFNLLAVLASENGIENFLSSLLTVIDAKADFHVYIRLEVSMCQFLEEVENNV